jgi:RNA polymerase sigma-70 factor (ECF subfamily)
MFRLAYRMLGDAGAAEEATVDALSRVWRRAGQWKGNASATTWIYRVTISAVLDFQRSRTRWWRRWSAAGPRTPPDRRPGPADEALHAEQSKRRIERVQRALNVLSPSDRALVHLYYWEQQSLAELEAVLGVPKANLKMRLARARQKLRELLEDGNGDT